MFRSFRLKRYGRYPIRGDVLEPDQKLLEEKLGAGSWSIPSKYQGEEIVCSSCNKLFTFSAAQKKEYYESPGGNIYARIHMCPTCYQRTKA